MKALDVFTQNNGDVTKAYYAELAKCGHAGELAVALFRAQKRSTAAKKYRGRRYKEAAYDTKNWSISEITRLLAKDNLGLHWGWKEDPNTPGFEWVLYVELPAGQCSFHSATRGQGPAFKGEWDGEHKSAEHIIAFCDQVPEINRREMQRREDFGPNGDATTPGFFAQAKREEVRPLSGDGVAGTTNEQGRSSTAPTSQPGLFE